MKDNLVFVFDLDDTLYKEIDFLKSAYKEIAQYIASKTNANATKVYHFMIDTYYKGDNPFAEVLRAFQPSNTDIPDLLQLYRHHAPNITLSQESKNLLTYLKANVYKIGLITDGRSTQQRSKIKALGLEPYLDDIIISEEFGSEKPNPNNFKFYETKYDSTRNYVYIGDNTKKDFVAPNSLGWTSICLLDGSSLNIHKQNFDLASQFLPHFKINHFSEVSNILKQI
jgi:putative hydrolase of the HAD superfamily